MGRIIKTEEIYQVKTHLNTAFRCVFSWKYFNLDISIYHKSQPEMNYTKHQITRETKAAEIYKGDSIKQNIRAINYQTRKGVQKAPFRVFLHIWERLYKR